MHDDTIVSGIITAMIADHMITFQSSNLEFKHIENNVSEKRTAQKINFGKFKDALKETDVDIIMKCGDIDTAYGFLQKKIDAAISSSTSMSSRCEHSRPQVFVYYNCLFLFCAVIRDAKSPLKKINRKL